MKDFRNLTVWARAHDVTLSIYALTQAFPKSELFGLTTQMRRAAVSTAGNIAEGCGRSGDLDFRCFLQMALGSASELEYYLFLAHDLNLITHEAMQKMTDRVVEVKRMLASLMKALGSKRNAGKQSGAES